MYFHQAMKAPDKTSSSKQWKRVWCHDPIRDRGIIPLSEVTEGAKLFPAVWAMRERTRPDTRDLQVESPHE
jgi:hypothetical protein